MWHDLDDTEVVNHIRENIADYEYRFKIDVPVVVRDELVIAVECKAYAENTMLKRILFDGYLIRRHSIRMPTLFSFNWKVSWMGLFFDIYKQDFWFCQQSYTNVFLRLQA